MTLDDLKEQVKNDLAILNDERLDNESFKTKNFIPSI